MEPFFAPNMRVLENGVVVRLVDKLPMTDGEEREIERLEAKLAASEGREGMAERVKAIRAQLEELRGE